MKAAIILLVFLGLGLTIRAQGALLVSLGTLYVGLHHEVSLGFEHKPSVYNSMNSACLRAGHNNQNSNWTFGHQFTFMFDAVHPDFEDAKFHNWTIGGYIEKKFRRDATRKYYLSMPATISIGGATSHLPNEKHKGFFGLAEVELFLNFKFGEASSFWIGPGYRQAFGSQVYGQSNLDLSGVSINAGLRFGGYK